MSLALIKEGVEVPERKPRETRSKEINRGQSRVRNEKETRAKFEKELLARGKSGPNM